MDEKDALFGMFKQYMEQGLHHQQQRSTIANIVLVLSGAIVGLVTFDNEICGPDVIAGIFLVGLGLFGAAWSAKQHERYAYYLQRARGYRDALAAALPLDMASIDKTADEATAKQYRILHRLRLWYFWTFLYVLVVAVGVLIVVYASQTPCEICDQDMEDAQCHRTEGLRGLAVDHELQEDVMVRQVHKVCGETRASVRKLRACRPRA